MNLLDKIPTINTVKDVQDVLAIILEKNKITDDQMIWANALWLASSLSEATTKNLAIMMMDGVSASNTIESVQHEIDTMKQDGEDEFIKSICFYIAYIVGDVFSEYEKAEDIRQLGESI